MVDKDELQIDVKLEGGDEGVKNKWPKSDPLGTESWPKVPEPAVEDNVLEFIAGIKGVLEEGDTDEVSVSDLIDGVVENKAKITQLTVIADWSNGGVTISGNHKEHTEWARHALLLNEYTLNLLKGEK